VTTHSVVSPLDSDNLKPCSKCGEWKPREAFYKARKHSDGLMSHCKSCQSEMSRRYREANPDKERARRKASYAANAEQRRQYSRDYREANPDRVRANSRSYYEAHKDEVREKTQQWRVANAESLKRYYRDTYAANRDDRRRQARERRARNVEMARKSARAWQRANLNSGRLYAKRRRARESGLPATFTVADWQAALDHFGGCCAVCGAPGTLHQDHWIPLTSADCPGTVRWNMIPLCVACNLSKHARPPAEWIAERFAPVEGAAIQRRIEEWLKLQGR
jgi:5-methylcytosine-specific restriction endonuclease McrA